MTESDSATLEKVFQWLELTRVKPPLFWNAGEWLTSYRVLISSGHTPVQILNIWKLEGKDPSLAGAFVTALKRIDAGIPIQDPNERPSMSEIIGGYKIPWGKITLFGLAALAVYGFSSSAGNTVAGRLHYERP